MARSNALRKQAFPKMLIDTIVFNGGLDEEKSPLEMPTGECWAMLNFEQSIFGGYRRIFGYERKDGRVSPSLAEYAIMQATITGAPAIGNTLTGLTSGATGNIIALPGGSFVLTQLVGTFQSGESLQVAGVTIATATSIAIIDGASTPKLAASYLALAANVYRALIGPVPGSGKVLGVWCYNGTWYAFRNNVGGTAAVLYKATASGWSLVAFEYEVTFSAATGAATIVDGGTLTQGGVTATIRRVLVRTGSLSAGTAAGTMVVAAPGGGNFAAGAATVGAGTLTIAGIQTAIALLPGGRFELVVDNFSGSIQTTRTYGCDGVNPAFEFDGTIFAPIHTGASPDTPAFVAAFQNQLFLGIGATAQQSAPGLPFNFDSVAGASEFAFSDTLTGFGLEPGYATGGAMAIYCRSRAYVLYGHGVADWQLVNYREGVGAFPYTAQTLGESMFLDDRGVTNLVTSQRFGNFEHAVLSNNIRNSLASKRIDTSASVLSFDLSQYRIFFKSGYGYYFTMGGPASINITPGVSVNTASDAVTGITQVLFPNAVRCAWSQSMADGTEQICFGSDNGYVYQMERGTSFDGAPINAYLNLAYNFQKTPRVKKKYRRASIEIKGTGYAEFQFGYVLGYSTTDISQPVSATIDANLSPVFWDQFTWDSFYWDGLTLMPNTADMGGSAENVSISITSNGDSFNPFTITATTLQYEMRRQLR